MDQYIFDDVNHALIWATEHLRRKSFPKVSDIYKKDISSLHLEEKDIKSWAGYKNNLPTDAEEAMLLAIKVYRIVRNLKPEEQQFVLLRYWGDYHSPQYLKSALQIKEAMRIRGQHVRLKYRFTYRQVAELQNVHVKKAERETKRILDELAKKMSEKGLIATQEKAPMSQISGSKNQGNAWDAEQFCRR